MDVSTPVVVLGTGIGPLAIMRSLGSLGVAVYGLGAKSESPAMMSRYCRGKYRRTFKEEHSDEFLNYILDIGDKLGGNSILIPTSDIYSVFAVENLESLRKYYRFPANNLALVRTLVSKRTMHELAIKHEVPTAQTQFPQNFSDVQGISEQIAFPVMLKGIDGHRLKRLTGKKMVVVRTPDELMSQYQQLEDPDTPNLMIQELIPGADDQVYIFNGYFDNQSNCLAAFTGRKIRQYPVHTGVTSLGECRWYEDVAALTTRFMKEIGYQGILDIGYRLDPRDGRYKVLDINPRVGQAFRLFVAENGIDVIRSLYLDLTGQSIDAPIPIEGRRWVIEDYDLMASFRYFQEGTLTFRQWWSSFRGVQEAAWFDWKDPLPFSSMIIRDLGRVVSMGIKRKTQLAINRPLIKPTFPR